jgi:hypothetical protein
MYTSLLEDVQESNGEREHFVARKYLEALTCGHLSEQGNGYFLSASVVGSDGCLCF